MKINPKFKKVAIQSIKEAGRVLKKNFRKNIKVFFKKDLTPITDVDLKANEIIVKIIKKNFPSHGIVSEESGGRFGKEFIWIIDPLDGTRNYTKGFPFFSVSLALLKEREPILGIVFNPLNGELYLAEKGEGAYLNGEKIKVNKINNLSKVILSFNKGQDLEGGLRILMKIAPHIGTFRFWGSVHLEMCQIALGKIEGCLVSKLAFYDAIAGAFIVKEAGGRVTDFEGRDWQINTKNILVTNGKIHNQLLKLIKSK